MSKKCSASHCITGSSRSSKITCANCRKGFHLKCVGLSSNQFKAIRDFPGAEWFCPACRNSPLDLQQSSINPVLNLILDRLASVLRLVGVQIDVTRSLCRALSENIRRTSINNRNSVPAQASQYRNFEDALNNLQLEFSNVFGSFIDADDNSAAKRDRTSSLSSSHLVSSNSGKRMRVDVPISTSDIANIIVPSIADATAVNIASSSEPVEACSSDINCITSTENASAATVTSITTSATPTASTTASTTPFTRLAPPPANSSHYATSTVAALRPATACSATLAATQAVFTTATQTSPSSATAYKTSVTTEQSTQTNFSALPKPPRTTQLILQSPMISAPASSATCNTTNTVCKNVLPPEDRHLPQSRPSESVDLTVPPTMVSSSGPTIPCYQSSCSLASIQTKNNCNSYTRPSLAIAQSAPIISVNSNDNWYYLTKFLPHETESNIINYIAHHTNCNPSHIVCQKLVRANSDTRPLSFLSFKIKFPVGIENVVLANGFWPQGVTITPFLDRRSNSRKPVGSQTQLRSILRNPRLLNQRSPSLQSNSLHNLQPVKYLAPVQRKQIPSPGFKAPNYRVTLV